MRIFGIFLVIAGAFWALVALNMDTTITTEAKNYGTGIYSIYTPSIAVNNIGLMDVRRNNLMFAGLTILAGVIFIGFGSISDGPRIVEDLKPCPFCAEQIQPAAIKCRFCNTELPPDFHTQQANAPANLDTGVEHISSIGNTTSAEEIPVESNRIIKIFGIIGALVIVITVAILVSFSKRAKQPSFPSTTPTAVAAPTSLPSPPLVFPAPNDPRAKATLRACVDGKVYAFEGKKWVPHDIIVGAPLTCIVEK